MLADVSALPPPGSLTSNHLQAALTHSADNQTIVSTVGHRGPGCLRISGTKLRLCGNVQRTAVDDQMPIRFGAIPLVGADHDALHRDVLSNGTNEWGAGLDAAGLSRTQREMIHTHADLTRHFNATTNGGHRAGSTLSASGFPQVGGRYSAVRCSESACRDRNRNDSND
jgi:hypothetical protein